MDDDGPTTDDGDLTGAMLRHAPGAAGSAVDGMRAALAAFLAACCAACSRRRVLTIGARRLAVERTLAEGGYSFVLLVRDAGSGEAFAVKQVLSQSAEQRAAVRREVDTLRALRGHPHVAPLLDVAFVRTDAGAGGELALLLFPLYRRGSLQDALTAALPTGGPFFSEDDVLHAVLCACAGLGALLALSPPLAHRDVCPRNLMLDGGGGGGRPLRAVLIDFGSAGPARVPLRSRGDALRLADIAASHCSPPYRAPELWDPPSDGVVDEAADGACRGGRGVRGAGWGRASVSDVVCAAATVSLPPRVSCRCRAVWSLGATLFALRFGLSPFESVRGDDGRLRLTEPTHVRCLAPPQFPTAGPSAAPPPSPRFRELLLAMLALDPARRPTLAAVAHAARTALGAAGAGGAGASASIGVTAIE